MPTRTANAVWNGSLQEGNGTMRMRSGAYEGPYTFQSRFKEGEGTNPEELIAAAHAACYAMAFSNILATNGHTPESVTANARVSLQEVDGAPTIARITLKVDGNVPGIDESTYQDLAEQAKKDCPVSRALASVPEITLEAKLA